MKKIARIEEISKSLDPVYNFVEDLNHRSSIISSVKSQYALLLQSMQKSDWVNSIVLRNRKFQLLRKENEYPLYLAKITFWVFFLRGQYLSNTLEQSIQKKFFLKRKEQCDRIISLLRGHCHLYTSLLPQNHDKL